MGAFRKRGRSLGSVSSRQKGRIARLSPHQKFPFPAIVETWFGDCLVGHQFEPYYLDHLARKLFFADARFQFDWCRAIGPAETEGTGAIAAWHDSAVGPMDPFSHSKPASGRKPSSAAGGSR